MSVLAKIDEVSRRWTPETTQRDARKLEGRLMADNLAA